MSDYTPTGKKYNWEDPLGVIKHEKEVEHKLTEPNPIIKFIEDEANKKRLTMEMKVQLRLTPPTIEELRNYFNDAIAKLLDMVVTYETKSGYKRGRIKCIGKNSLQVELKNTKVKKWVDFDEVIRLKKNYD